MDEATERLRLAIIQAAIEDYARALKWLKDEKKWEKKYKANPKYAYRFKSLKGQYEYIRDDCKTFFKSNWYAQLCDIDGRKVMEMVYEDVYSGKCNMCRLGNRVTRC